MVRRAGNAAASIVCQHKARKSRIMMQMVSVCSGGNVFGYASKQESGAGRQGRVGRKAFAGAARADRAVGKTVCYDQTTKESALIAPQALRDGKNYELDSTGDGVAQLASVLSAPAVLSASSGTATFCCAGG